MVNYAYVCNFQDCFRTFRTKFNLKRHINSFHFKLKRFKCEQCSKCFASKQNLKEHSYIHTGERFYKCPELNCGKRFKQPSQLLVHNRIHLRAKSLISEEALPPKLSLTDEWSKVAFGTHLTLPKIKFIKKQPKVKLPLPPGVLFN